MRGWSIFAGRFFGVEFRVHLTFLFLLFFIFITEFANSGSTGGARGLVLVGLIFVSVILHESGHAIVAVRSGVPVRGIMLLPIGGVTLMDPQQLPDGVKNAIRETRIAIAGPVVNFLLAAASAAILLIFRPSVNIWEKPWISSAGLSRSFFWINISLFTFNLLPAFPMDGGRILRAWMARKMEFQQATRRAVTIGQIFAALFMLMWALSPWFMILGVFMFIAAQMEERTVLFQSVVETVRMEDIMLTDFSTLSPADTLEDALHKAVHTLQDDFPVVRGGDLVGVINRHTIVDRLRREGNGYVQAAMNKAFEIASRTESLASAFRKLTSRGLTLIPVVEQEHLVGIVTLQNLMHSMGLLAESRRLRRQSDEL